MLSATKQTNNDAEKGLLGFEELNEYFKTYLEYICLLQKVGWYIDCR